MIDSVDPAFHLWYETLERRYLRDLSFAEVRRAVQALSFLYVERRREVSLARAFDGRGKRAAFGLFYAPLHFATIREVVRRLEATDRRLRRLHDLGCGTGAGGAAWALECAERPFLRGVDVQRWAVDEANWSWSRLGLSGRAKQGRVEQETLPEGAAVLLAYTVSELPDRLRDELLPRLHEVARRGTRVLIVEPISRRAVPWWDTWAASFEKAGGRADRWRFAAALPERLRLLDKAAGLDHRELTARSLYLSGTAG